jgi:5-methylcytosine-specific restriction endonuclease McrA
VRSPEPTSRLAQRGAEVRDYDPAAIRREVWTRDAGRCSYESPESRKCGAREYLEFHHQVPWARCREHAPSNISLRCRSHNRYAAVLAFGSELMAAYRRSGSASPVAEEAEPSAPGRSESLHWI